MMDAFKAAGMIASMMKNPGALKAAGDRIKSRLADLRATGQSASGAVRATVNGHMLLLDLTIDPAIARHATGADPDAAAAARLITEAVNDAIRRAQSLAQQEISKEASTLGLPPIPGLDSLLGSR